MNRNELARDFNAGLLLGLAPREVFGALARVIDDPRNDFELPTGISRKMRGEAELLDEDDFIALWIVKQHADRLAALENLALHFRAPAAGIETVAQAIAVEAGKALVDGLAF